MRAGAGKGGEETKGGTLDGGMDGGWTAAESESGVRFWGASTRQRTMGNSGADPWSVRCVQYPGAGDGDGDGDGDGHGHGHGHGKERGEPLTPSRKACCIPSIPSRHRATSMRPCLSGE